MARLPIQLLCMLLLTTVIAGGCATPEFFKRLAGQSERPIDVSDDASQLAADELNRRSAQNLQQSGIATIDTPADSTAAIEKGLIRGQQAEAAGNLTLARTEYQQVIYRLPSHWQAHHRLGVIADQLGDFDGAKQHYNLALRNVPGDDPATMSRLLNDIGYSFLLQGDYARSEEALDSALKSDPQNTAALRNLAVVYGFRGDYARAMTILTKTGGVAQARSEMSQLFPDWESQIANESGHNTVQRAMQVDGVRTDLVDRSIQRTTAGESGILQAPIPVQKQRVRTPKVPVVVNASNETERGPVDQQLIIDPEPNSTSPESPSLTDSPTRTSSPSTTAPSDAQLTKANAEAALRLGHAIGPGMMFPTQVRNPTPTPQKPNSGQAAVSSTVDSGKATIKTLPYSGNSSVKTLPYAANSRVELLSVEPASDGNQTERVGLDTTSNQAVREFEARFEARRQKQKLRKQLNPNRE